MLLKPLAHTRARTVSLSLSLFLYTENVFKSANGEAALPM